MPFGRFDGKRGGLIRLNNYYKRDSILQDPYDPGKVLIYDPVGSIIASGVYPGDIIRSGEGTYYYNYQTTSGMTVGLYTDNWYDIKFTASADAVSGLHTFQVMPNDEDRAVWVIEAG